LYISSLSKRSGNHTLGKILNINIYNQLVAPYFINRGAQKIVTNKEIGILPHVQRGTVNNFKSRLQFLFQTIQKVTVSNGTKHSLGVQVYLKNNGDFFFKTAIESKYQSSHTVWCKEQQKIFFCSLLSQGH